MAEGRLVDIGDTRLHIVERGTPGATGVLVLHGGPGLDHTEFGSHLDELGDEFNVILVDQREQGRSDRGTPQDSWTVPRFAADVDALAAALELERYAVLGHSFGAFVALHHAVEHVNPPAATIISSGVPSLRWLEGVEAALHEIADEELRSQVIASFEREEEVETEREVLEILRDQLPFHFANAEDPRIEAALEDLETGVMSPDVLRVAPQQAELELEDRLGEIAHPVLVLAGRHDRLTTVEAAEAIAAGIRGAALFVFEDSAHMAFAEEAEAYRGVVRDFLTRTLDA
jgi:proline-specific peptidase